MANRITEFESRREKYLFFAIIGSLIVVGATMMYPVVNAKIHDGTMDVGRAPAAPVSRLEAAETPDDYYKMFQCSCCGRPIDSDCCGMAKQGKEYLDNLLLEESSEDEVLLKMVKKFGFGILTDPAKEPEIREYIRSQASDEPPSIELDKTRYDFGTVSQSDGIVSTRFVVRNSGTSDLIIENLDTSCMCTSARFVFEGTEGPLFGMSMHGDNPTDYELRIAPGDSAELVVYYDSMAHGIQEKPELKIIREVTIISNDPVDFQKKIRIELTQVP